MTYDPSTEHVGKNALLDLAKLEADVAAAIPARSLMPINGAPSVQSDPMSDYVGVPRVAALSAEAMVRDHESAAKEIEAMGAELISAAMKCEAMTAEVHNAIAYMREIAAAYREEAKKIFKRIEDCALFTEDVRKTCETVKRRIETSDLRADTAKVIDLPNPLRRAN